MKWNRFACNIVATKVRVVKAKTAGTAIRVRVHSLSLAARTSRRKLAKYPPPRNAAVRGGWIVQAKYRSVCSVRMKSWKPARKTSAPATIRSLRIAMEVGLNMVYQFVES